ncbi:MULTISPECIES: pyrroline-5-carboxylate reductase [Thalassospira]|uniref:pyrroline-5-carboxylate reductase n=1 Tax=Thalassospira TaxID=168934 RepID=UPI001AD9D55A|nr:MULTISPECIES: pyrroline-5-carboxylate reductase [Thalassospira]MBO9506179.1 pyrroline-5-carboxylate reductase [Thalassospira sp. A3_1]WOI11762.1 pyrroline-5-carboxylate reductase [Thalassospira lucentensis]
MNTRLLLVGCGKMGSAMLEGWLAKGLKSDNVYIVEQAEAAEKLSTRYGVHGITDVTEVPQDFIPQVILFAVKPQVLPDVIDGYKPLVRAETVFLSVAAGKTIDFFAGHLGETARIVRAMPNTPAAVSRGMTVMCPTDNVSQAQRDMCETLLATVGMVSWVSDESLMDAVTALSGSGPAYIFHLVEAMAQAGEAAGLPADQAMMLARQTVVGAGFLLDASEETASTLRENVTSPGGTTAAALSVLMDAQNGLPDLMTRAVEAARKRSVELAG